MDAETLRLAQEVTLVGVLVVATVTLWRAYILSVNARVEELQDEVDYWRDLNKNPPGRPYVTAPQIMYRAPPAPPSDDPRKTQPLPPEELLSMRE